MEDLGNDLSGSGTVMTKIELEAARRKRGECLTCGRKCFTKKYFKMIPITDNGRVLNGRCLKCRPIDPRSDKAVLPAETRPVTQEEMSRFQATQGAAMRSASMQHTSAARSDGSAMRNASMQMGTGFSERTEDPSQDVVEVVSMPPVQGQGQTRRGSVGYQRTARRASNSHSTDSSDHLDPRKPPARQDPDGSAHGSSGHSHRLSSPPEVNLDAQDANEEKQEMAHSTRGRRRSMGSNGVMSRTSSAGSEAMERKSSQRSLNANNDERQLVERIQSSDSGYQEVIKLMRQNVSSQFIQQAALKKLADINLTPEEQSDIAANGGIDVIVKGMASHPKEEDIQFAACRAFWNLSGSAENQVTIVEAGGIDTLLAAMDTFKDNSAIQEKGMAVLSNLAAAAENQDAILGSGVITAVIEGMNKHSEDVLVQQTGCAAITNLASHDLGLKKSLVDAGGPGAIVVSMIMHSTDAELQEKAIRALRNISANDDENKVIVNNVGGIDAIITAMQVHRDEAGVQEAGAWTLSNLAANKDNKEIIGDSGGIDVIVRAMWVHSEDAAVQEWACRALWTLSVDETNKQIVIDVGGISAVVNAMHAHAGEGTVQEKGCGVLANLAANDDNNKVRIVEEEALDAVVMAMVLHTDNKLVQDRSLSLLKKLACASNIKPMQAANVAELVMIARDKFPGKCGDKARHLLSLL